MTGIICINKDEGISSFGAVAKVRAITGEKKAGHTGTLDPMATGVLPIMLGGATRFLDYLPMSDKGYEAEFLLGKTTDTLDITGTLTAEKEVNCRIDDVENTLKAFVGNIKQLPPMYSAVSVDGKRLYELARQGKEIDRPKREVEIKKLSLCPEYCDEKRNRYTISVLCSKGTYIRTLIDDIGKALGCGAVMTSLKRTLASGFSLDECITISQLQQLKNSGGDFSGVVFDIESVFLQYPFVYVSEKQAKRFKNGGFLDADRIKTPLKEGIYRVYSPDKVFLGLGEYKSDENELSVRRLLVRRD